MGPYPEPNKVEEDYEQDGWYIGYEVQMEGLGVVNVYEETNNSDSESDGYVGPENDSDDENASTRRAGYMAVPSNVESDSDAEESKEESVSGPSNVLAPVQKAFQSALNDAHNVHLSNKDFQFESHKDIPLTPEKIDEIKLSMANFKIQTPEWANNTNVDDKIISFLNSQKDK